MDACRAGGVLPMFLEWGLPMILEWGPGSEFGDCSVGARLSPNSSPNSDTISLTLVRVGDK